ncbi:restriction endonuclease subunit S [Xanthomonas oryzae pv. oryzae]|nr:restriction endonuclease subunit S [Xanthomonas oryzae]
MSELPQGWAFASLNELQAQGGIFADGDWIESKDQDPNGRNRLLQLADIGDGRFIDKSSRYVNDETFDRLNCTALEEGDILLARMPDPLGRACLMPRLPQRCLTVVDVAVFRSGSRDISHRWLMHTLNASPIREEISRNASGTTRKRIARGKLAELKVPVPPAAEQKRIAQKLDALLAQVDTLKARIDAIPALLKRFRDSVLRAAVSGRLTEEWRASNPSLTAQAMLEGFKPLPPPARYKSRSDAFIQGVCATAVGKPRNQLTHAWEWTPLVQVARMESGHTPSREVSEYWGGDVPWIGIKDARANHEKSIYSTQHMTNQLGLKNSAARLLPGGTICISRTASVGYVVKMGIPMATSQDFVNWVPTECVDADWLKWLFVAEKESLFKFGKGSTHTTVYFPEWLSMHVALPHVDEQKVIATRVQSLLDLADSLADRVATAQQRIDALTQSLLAKAFRGELVPQDPSDEPASVLLDRTRTQRAAAPKPKRGRKAATS